jgi:hypothetical protein
VLGGKSFGKVYFAVDPDDPHNKIIVDLDEAPKNTLGKVESLHPQAKGSVARQRRRLLRYRQPRDTKASPSTSRGGRRSMARSCRPAPPGSAASTNGSLSPTISAHSRRPSSRFSTTRQPIRSRQDGLGSRIPARLEPKIMLVDSASEYWDRGRVSALRDVSLDGREDVEDAPNVRVFMLAGTRHGSGSFPPADNGGQFKENTNDYRWAERGLLAALDAWVRQGMPPPESRHPKLSDLTLVAHENFKFPPIPGAQLPTNVPGGYRGDVPGPYSALPFLVSKVDADGNDLGGIRLPEQAVPLATLTGWQFRSERIGAPNTLIAMAGAFIPFPATRAERERTRDPRQSIAERYGTRADYLKKIQESAQRLAQERYILQVDVPAIVQEAGRHWDSLMTPARPTSQAARQAAQIARDTEAALLPRLARAGRKTAGCSNEHTPGGCSRV